MKEIAQGPICAEELTCCHDLGVRFYLLERDERFHAKFFRHSILQIPLGKK